MGPGTLPCTWGDMTPAGPQVPTPYPPLPPRGLSRCCNCYLNPPYVSTKYVLDQPLVCLVNRGKVINDHE